MKDRYGNSLSHRYNNPITDPDEIVSEFLVGVWQSMGGADLELGDPIAFLAWSGRKRVSSFLRSRLRRRVRQTCTRCGRETVLTNHACKKCAGVDFVTYMIEGDDDSSFSEAYLGGEDLSKVVLEQIMVDRFRDTLSGRVLDLYDRVLERASWRERGVNYLGEIAETWGVSVPTVAVYLRRLRAKVRLYLEIPDNV